MSFRDRGHGLYRIWAGPKDTLVILYRADTVEVIKERKTEFMRKMNEKGNNSLDEVMEELGSKRKLAFLDSLLVHHIRNPREFTESDIREEVDTFMFEGHDTTAAAIQFSLILIGLDNNVQVKIHEEMDAIFGDDMCRDITTDDLRQMRYLEQCIKEALRLYPSVPYIARENQQDFSIGEHVIPKGSTCVPMIYMLHRDPKVFPNPEVYDPNRFASDGPDVQSRHPYAYVPFSAGPRNCIGQKFALLEEKALLAAILRRYRIRCLIHRDQLVLDIAAILKPHSKIPMSFVIKERKNEIMKKMSKKGNNSLNEVMEELGSKRKLAFLDSLLVHHIRNPREFTENDIREEVDTFMFEGHDTTAGAIQFSLILIGLDDSVQAKIHKEMDGIFGDDMCRDITTDDLRQMRYLEQCIKEALRLYPSVPLIARQNEQDFSIGEHVIPKGSTCMVLFYMLHRDPKVFPNPEVYDPNRFASDGPDVQSRHPYAYVPFSAGPRNCIGQKFALLEEKALLAAILRRYRILCLIHRDQLELDIAAVLKPRSKIPMSFTKRF
ncbi:unnamed protein product [Medioppia subpectinata]|uniref:Cytochrome P450 n=1 Tax=Medioppia subpectinata TaxID=1979941 RepID=A0A7R9PZR1_9ACAR|nr:unnamed protein product [Medioppia subpectinata]CAG2107241.1 unnamed protein product [Medioppia subpectinata]